jgi:hypothetical protein
MEDSMMSRRWIAFFLIGFLILTIACSFSKKDSNQVANEEPAAQVQSNEPNQQQSSGNSTQQDQTDSNNLVELRQWASSAKASSEFGSDNWSADQATGKPDTKQCADETSAWASGTSNGVDWIELSYDTPVTPTSINILQTYNPSQVTEVILYDTQGSANTIYQADPKKVTECPFTLSIPVKQAKYETQRIRIKVDQSQLGTSWNEIDAVELVGMAASLSQEETPSAFKSSGTTSSDAPRFFYDELDGSLSDLWVDEVYYSTAEGEADVEPVYTIEQERGKLKFYLETPWQYVYYLYTPQTYRNVRIDFEVVNKGVNTNNIGLVCRFSDYGYYEFIATSGGYYSIMRYYEDGDKELAAGGIKSIRFGTGKTNVFTAICDEDYLYFIVNDVEITKVYDGEIQEGLVGINVSAEDVVPVQVEFEWIEISEP